MTDWRRYTGTPRPQLAWSLLAVLGVAVAVALVGSVAAVGVVAGWLVGLLVLGVRERRKWSRLVAESPFERQSGARRADLQKILRGRSVTVATDLAGIVAQTHTEVTTAVTGVDADFTVVATTEAEGRGVVTGSDAIDGRFTVRGSERNVELVLSPDVQDALLALDLPGTLTVSGSRVVFEVPFTQLTPAELERAADLVVTAAKRVEDVAS